MRSKSVKLTAGQRNSSLHTCFHSISLSSMDFQGFSAPSVKTTKGKSLQRYTAPRGSGIISAPPWHCQDLMSVSISSCMSQSPCQFRVLLTQRYLFHCCITCTSYFFVLKIFFFISVGAFGYSESSRSYRYLLCRYCTSFLRKMVLLPLQSFLSLKFLLKSICGAMSRSNTSYISC